MDREKIARTLKNLNQLAIHEVRQHNYARALEFFIQGLCLEDKLGLKAEMAESFFNLASTYYLMEDYEQALHKIQLSETLFIQEGKGEDLSRARQMEAQIRMKREGKA